MEKQRRPQNMGEGTRCTGRASILCFSRNTPVVHEQYTSQLIEAVD